MELLQLFFILLFGHWLGDFVLQSHWMATNKSKNNYALLLHTITYTVVMTGTFIVGITVLAENLPDFPYFEYGVLSFALLTFVSHGLTDFFTSRLTAKLWAAQRFHTFFVMVGFDQLIHFYTIILTLLWSVGHAFLT